MLDLLLDVLGELLGLGNKAPPPPRRTPQRGPRPARPAAPQPSQPDPAQLRQLLERARESKPARRAAPALVPAPLPVYAPEEEFAAPPAPTVRDVFEGVFEDAPAPERGAGGGAPAPATGFIAALRSNPSAARQAFVYSEIFGKPLADRQSVS